MKFDVILPINGVPAVQTQLNPLGTISHHEMEETVEHKNDWGMLRNKQRRTADVRFSGVC